MKRFSPRLTKFSVKGYRSCRVTTFEPKENLTVLVGPNGTGKTNILQAMRLLRGVLRRRYAVADRESQALTSAIEADYRVGDKTVSYRASIKYTTDDRNRDEVLAADERWNLRSVTGEDSWIPMPSDILLHWMRPRVRVVEKRGGDRVLQIFSKGSEPPLPQETVSLLSSILRFVSETSYYSASQFTNPSRCPSYIEIDEDGDLRESHLHPNEHLRFLYDLYRAWKTSRDDYDKYVSLVGPTGIGLLTKLDWKEVKAPSNVLEVRSGGKVVKKKRDRILVIPTIRVRNAQLSFNQLSEGTFKTLALLLYLVIEKSELLLLEEPEVCVHHGLLTSVIEVIKTFSGKKQIIFSTHSDYVLDAMEPENVFVVTNSEASGTKLKAVTRSLSAKRFRALREYLDSTGSLGEYWKHGGF